MIARSGLLGGGIELVQAWVAQRDTIDVAADFNAAKPQRLDVGQAAGRQCWSWIGTMPIPMKLSGWAEHNVAIERLI